MNAAFWATCLLSQLPFVVMAVWAAPIPGILSAILTLVLLAWKWDRLCRFPTSPTITAAIGFSLGISLIAAILYLPWMATFCFSACLFCFLGASADRQGNTMLALGFLSIPCLMLAPELESNLEAASQDMIVSMSAASLQSLQIPYLESATEFIFSGTSVQTAAPSWFSWRLCILCGVLYCILRDRSWLVTAGNLLLLTCFWYLGRCLLICLPGLLPTSPLIACQIASLLSVVLLFLSGERAVRGLLAPINDEQTDSPNANPLISGWNLMNSKAIPALADTQPARPVLAGLLLLCAASFVLQLVGTVRNVGSAQSSELSSTPAIVSPIGTWM